MIRTDFSDLVPIAIGLTLGGAYTDLFFSHNLISDIAIFFGLKSDLFFIFAIVFFICSLIKNIKNSTTNNRLEKIFFTIFSLKNGFLCVSGFLFSASIFSFNNHLQEAAMFLSVSIYIYFLACGIRLIEEKICYEIYEFIQPLWKK